MILYHPIESCVAWTGSFVSDLISFDWQTNTAKFFAEDDDQAVEVIFDDAQLIVRILDEFALSTESEPEKLEGLIPYHFAYWVEGDPFFKMQSATWLSIERNPRHYRFLTLAGCLDVISSVEPRIVIVDA